MSAKPGPDSPRCQALLGLLRAADTVWNASRLFFDRWQVSPSQFNILNLLHIYPDGRSQSDLGRELIMHRSNVTGLIDRLEKRGLVSRKEVELDRRAYNVVLTGQGRSLVEEILPEYYGAADRLWEVVPRSRLGTIISDLRAVTENAVRLGGSLEVDLKAPAPVRRGSQSRRQSSQSPT